MSFKAPQADDLTIPSYLTSKEFGKVNVRPNGSHVEVQFTILMTPQGQEAEGWQTGIALDASQSMKGLFGQRLRGSIPSDAATIYRKKGWIRRGKKDGREIDLFRPAAFEDAVEKGYLAFTPNEVEPVARKFIAYLADELDVGGSTTVIYWACGNGDDIEVFGDISREQCATIRLAGPQEIGFGSDTILAPALRYFLERFKDAKRSMFVFMTDGILSDLAEVKTLTVQLARDIAGGKRNPIKCVLIGLGEGIDQRQMFALDDLETGTEVDIWDYKVAREMRDLVEIFAEVVDENQIVAPMGTIYSANGDVIKRFTDGLPAKVSVSLPVGSAWFELEVAGQRIRQTVTMTEEQKGKWHG